MAVAARHLRRTSRPDYSWQEEAKCVGVNTNNFYLQGMEGEARQFCGDCKVRAECLAFSLVNREEFGVWGGFNEMERRYIRRYGAPHRLSSEEQKRTYTGALRILQER